MGMTTAIVSRKPLVSHCAVLTVTRRSAISAGSATLMIVPLRIMTNAEPTSSAITGDAPSGAVLRPAGSGGPAGSASWWPVAGPVIEGSCRRSGRDDATHRVAEAATEFSGGRHYVAG